MSKKLNFIIFLIISLSILLIITSLLLNIKYENELLDTQIQTLETSIKNEYKKRLKESVNQTIIFIDTSYKNKLKKQLTSNILSKEIEKEFMNEIRDYLYNSIFEKTRYTWIHKIVNNDGGENYAIRLIHPNLKKTEGIYLSTTIQDIKGNTPYLEEIEGIKEKGEVYLTYYFKQLDSIEITEKLSFSKLYKKLNWSISTGIPINYLNKVIQVERSKLKRTQKIHIFKIIILSAVIVILFVLLLLILRNKLAKALEENEKLNKQLEDKFETLETNFLKFFELPLNILILTNFKADILQINSGWKRILGYEEKDILNTSFLDLVHPNDREKTITEIQKLSKGKPTFYFENRCKHKNGSYRTLSWSANSFPEKELIYASAQDISELKEKSNLMYQQAKMAAIGEMTENIAHQWRQPLSIISTSSSGILLKKMSNDLEDKFLIDTMNQITKSTQYLSNTIEDFRNFYTPNNEKNIFSIEQIIEKILNLIKKRFQNDEIEIIKNIEHHSIITYENELLQVLINILNNARDQLEKIDLDKKLIFINVYEKKEYIYFEIIDNGEGIDEKIINRIFEPYYTTKDKSVGTGIGLYMCNEIVRKHLKGQIKVENHQYNYDGDKYKGAKFTIVLDKRI